MIITRQNHFFFIVFMLMASTFFPLLFNNLPPLFRSHHIWTILWFVSVLTLLPRILFQKSMNFLWLYGIFLVVSLLTFNKSMDDWNKKLLINEFYQIAVSVSVISYFDYVKDYKSLAIITKWSLVFLFVTAIMSIVSATIDPMYARNIVSAGSIVSGEEREQVMAFKKYGGSGYSTAIAFIGIVPLFLYYYKNKYMRSMNRKYILLFIVSLYLALISIQIFTNILLAVVVLLFSLVSTERRKSTIILVSLVAIIFLAIPNDIYADGLRAVAGLFQDQSELNYKFNDFAQFIETGASIDQSTGAGARVERYPMLWESFVHSPVMGCYYLNDSGGYGYMNEGGHLYWMNKLTVTGLVGLLMFVLMIYNIVKSHLRKIKTDYRYYYLLAVIFMLGYGIFKAIVGREMWYTLIILLAGAYYLPLLKRNRK